MTREKIKEELNLRSLEIVTPASGGKWQFFYVTFENGLRGIFNFPVKPVDGSIINHVKTVYQNLKRRKLPGEKYPP